MTSRRAPLQQLDEAWLPRLRPDTRAERAVRSVMGWGLAWPWFDRLALWSLVHYFFPMSRMWAAAAACNGVPDRFFNGVPMAVDGVDIDRLQAILFRTESARATVAAIDQRWQSVFFGADAVPVEERVAMEAARLDAADVFNRLRGRYRFLLRKGVPIVKAQTPSLAEVEAAYGRFRDDRAPLFTAPDPMPAVEVSSRVPGAVGTDFWLQFNSPHQRPGGTVYARVHEPEGVKNPPTLIFAHGICVDFDHWHGLVDEVDALCSMGVRVIRPEAPFHGRRRPEGCYSGEAIVATSPAGSLDCFVSALREWSVLADWARRTSDGPLAIGGSSLGALSSLLCADVSRHWPAQLQPQAMLLITHAGHQSDALIDGELAAAWKSSDAMAKAGWTRDKVQAYMQLLDPDWTLAPVVPPEHIITVLGSYDRVTPTETGLQLMDAWRVPQRNRFLWRRGHFSVPMTMIRRSEPLAAFVRTLSQIG